MLFNIFHSGGLWAIPLALFLASVWHFYRAYRIHTSGLTLRDTDPNSPTEGKWFDISGKYPYGKIGAFIFACVFLLAAIGAFIWINSDYKGV